LRDVRHAFQFRLQSALTAIDFMPDGKHLVVGDVDGELAGVVQLEWSGVSCFPSVALDHATVHSSPDLSLSGRVLS
jgi:hypothetical protein